MLNKEDKTSDKEDKVDSSGSQQVDANKNQDNNIINPQALKDNSIPSLPTPAKTPEP